MMAALECSTLETMKGVMMHYSRWLTNRSCARVVIAGAMRTIWLSLLGMGLVVFLAGLTLDQGPGVETAPASPARHYVFAHYMVCYATYGESLEGEPLDLRGEAQQVQLSGQTSSRLP